MSKLLTLISLGQSAYGRWLFRRLLSGVFMVAIISLVMAAMISALLIACLYAGYAAMLAQGLSVIVAGSLAGLAAITLILGMGWGLYAMVRSLRYLPNSMLGESPIPGQAKDIFDAFISGVMDDDVSKRPMRH